MVSVKAAFSIEANSELDKYTRSKYHYISVSGDNIRTTSNESVQAIYSMTKVIDKTKITEPVF